MALRGFGGAAHSSLLAFEIICFLSFDQHFWPTLGILLGVCLKLFNFSRFKVENFNLLLIIVLFAFSKGSFKIFKLDFGRRREAQNWKLQIEKVEKVEKIKTFCLER